MYKLVTMILSGLFRVDRECVYHFPDEYTVNDILDKIFI